jgi:hypothetical protein
MFFEYTFEYMFARTCLLVKYRTCLLVEYMFARTCLLVHACSYMHAATHYAGDLHQKVKAEISGTLGRP